MGHKNNSFQILYQVCHYTSVIGWFLFWMKGKFFYAAVLAVKPLFGLCPFLILIPQHFFSSPPLHTRVSHMKRVDPWQKKRRGRWSKIPLFFPPPIAVNIYGEEEGGRASHFHGSSATLHFPPENYFRHDTIIRLFFYGHMGKERYGVKIIWIRFLLQTHSRILLIVFLTLRRRQDPKEFRSCFRSSCSRSSGWKEKK